MSKASKGKGKNKLSEKPEKQKEKDQVRVECPDLEIPPTHFLKGQWRTFSLQCGKCGKEFIEEGGDEFSSEYPYEIGEGDWIQCPHCLAELEISANAQAGAEEEE